MKSSSVVSFLRKVTVSWAKCSTAMRIEGWLTIPVLQRGNCQPAGLLQIRPAASRRRQLLLDQRTLAFAERPCGLLGRDGRDQLVVVPGIFRFLRVLGLEQIDRKHLTA